MILEGKILERTDSDSIVEQLIEVVAFGRESGRLDFLWIDAVVDSVLLVHFAFAQGTVVGHFRLVVPQLCAHAVWVILDRSDVLDQFASFVEDFFRVALDQGFLF